MYRDLPESLKRRVKEHLNNNEFPKAKAIHDAWLTEHTLVIERSVRTHAIVISGHASK